MNIMFAAMLGGWEMILILAVVLILFGAKKLPELAKGLGTGIKEFKKATQQVTSEIQNAADDTYATQRKLPTEVRLAENASPASSSSNPTKA